MRFKKTIIFLIIIAILAGVGFYAYNKLTTKAVAYMIKTVADSLTEEELETVIMEYAESVVVNTNDFDEQQRASVQKVIDSVAEGQKVSDVVPEIDIKEIEKKLTPEDKEFVMDVYKRFSTDEVSHATSLVKGGITPEEKQVLKEMLKAKLNSEEKTKVVNMYSKYIITE